jgi:ketosteroid isomerase-like protein
MSPEAAPTDERAPPSGDRIDRDRKSVELLVVVLDHEPKSPVPDKRYKRGMNPERERQIREGYERWNRGDLDAILADMHPEIEFRVSGVVPGVPPVIRGRQGIEQLFRTWYSEVWDGPLQMEVEQILEIDEERHLVLITFTGRGAGSGIEVTLRYGHLITERDGLTYRVEGFADWDTALRRAGFA